MTPSSGYMLKGTKKAWGLPTETLLKIEINTQTVL